MVIKVGITGGIGSGKTMVCKVFKLLGIPVFYSDEESKKLLFYDADINRRISKQFGTAVIGNQGTIDKGKLAIVVFSNKEKLEQLNAILHPAVALRFEEWVKEHHESKYILKEAAILFESGANKQVDTVITVIAPVGLRIQRAMQRDEITREQVLERMKNQMNEEEKIKLSQFTIQNDDEQLLIPQVMKIHNLLLEGK